MVIEYFCLELGPQIQVALPLDSMVEVLKITPDQICAIPGVDQSLLGVMNWRGQLLWMVNLGDLLGIRKTHLAIAHPTLHALPAVVIAQENPHKQLACVVSELKGIVDITTDEIQPISKQLFTKVHPYVKGWVQLDGSILLLNPPTILNSPRWQTSNSLTPQLSFL
jgi:twitching motility protein PilI